MDIGGILFDKDGTLLDFEQTWMPAYGAALDDLCATTGDATLKERCLAASGYDAELGRAKPNSPMAADGNDQIAAIWLRTAGQEASGDKIERLVKIMETHAAENPKPLFDIAALFASLKGRGLALGIATMDAEWSARRSLAQMSADHYVSFFAGYDSGHGRKPEPGMVTAFCAEAGLRPHEIMVVGDNLHDLHMAKNAAAALAVGVCSGVGGRRDLSAVADHIVEDAGAIEVLLDSIEVLQIEPL